MVVQAKTRVTFEEYTALPETNQIVELIDGEIVVNPPNFRHQKTLRQIIFSLQSLTATGELGIAPAGVHFDDGNSPEPDLFWVSAENDHCVLEANGSYWHGAPDLVIEILSPSTQANDRGFKFELYQKYGVREYWLVEPELRFVEVFRHENGQFVRQGLFKAGQPFVSAVLGGATIETQTWFSGEARKATMNIPEYIERLPKAEMHLHLEGAIPWFMICDAAVEPLPEIPQWCDESFRYTDFDHFTSTMQLGNNIVLTTAERYHAVAKQVFRNLAEQNTRYVEISFGANLLERRKLSVAEVTAAIREAAPANVCVRVVAAFNRAWTHPLNDALVQEIMQAGVDGIDLHGKETPQSAPPYAEIFDLARQTGLMNKAHAGEMMGAESVWDACNFLKVPRIEHGTRAVEDEALVEYLVREQITLDMCPTSNYKLRVVETLAAHPIKHFFDLGIPVTVNTDDPTYFGCSLTDELYTLVNHLGFSLADIAEVEKNAFRVAKIAEPQREAIIAEIDALVAELS